MIINRVVELKHAGVWKDFIAPKKLKLAPRTLIYGLNGSGKTILSRVFSSIERGSLEERLPEETVFKIETLDKTIITQKLNSNPLEKCLLVFNTDFISRNFEWDSGSTKGIFYLSEKKVGTKRKHDDITSEIESATLKVTESRAAKEVAEKDLKKFKTEVARRVRETAPSMNYTQRYDARKIQQHYTKTKFGENLNLSGDARIRYQEILSQRGPLPKLIFSPTLPQELIGWCQDSLVLLTQSISIEIIEELEKHANFLRWVEEGFCYHEEQTIPHCLLCGNKFSDARRTQLRTLFDKSWTKALSILENRLSQGQEYQQKLREIYRSIPKEIEIIASERDTFSTHRESIEKAITQIGIHIGNILRCLISRLDRPTAMIDVPAEIEDFDLDNWLSEYTEIKDSILMILKRHNDTFEDFSSTQEDAFTKLEAHVLAIHQNEWDNLQNILDDAIQENDKNQMEANTLSSRELELRNELRDHGVGADMLNELIWSYLGHKEFRLLAEDGGYKIVRSGDKPATELSEGEKTALSFCYFLTQLGANGRKMENLVLIIDDPVSSLDESARTYAFSLLNQFTKECAQVVILTHNIDFMHMVKREYRILHDKDEERYRMTILSLDCQNSEDVIDRSTILTPMNEFSSKDDRGAHQETKPITDKDNRIEKLSDQPKRHASENQDNGPKVNALALLRQALDDPVATFRVGQWEAIDALVNRQERLLVVQRTGWGKSSVYFIATRILRDRGHGPTLIVSPLLALMRNQIDAAKGLGILAFTINSANDHLWHEVEQALQNNEADVLLVSPERLANEEFVENTLWPIAGRIGLLVVDEAHCISDWGHDFRPDYRRLVSILQHMPVGMPILGTTATANNRVVEDIQTQLGNIGIQRGSLMRSTLAMQTLQLPTRVERLAWLAEHMESLPGTGIIYTLTTRDARQVADWLQSHGIKAEAYFSGVVNHGFENSNAYREHLEQQLLDNKIKALVATTALGMGYDKPDLGFVVHYQAPGSIVAYYQQVGRAGRAIDHAVCILMAGEEDQHIHDYFRTTAFPKEQWVIKILEALEESDGMSIQQLEGMVNLRSGQIKQVIKFLSVENPAPVIQLGSLYQRTPTPYTMDHDKIERLTKQRQAEWEEVQRYIAEQGCLMKFLATALDDTDPQPCGKCARCLGRPVVNTGFMQQKIDSAIQYLRHAEIELKCKSQVAQEALTKHNLQSNIIPTEFRAETGRVLCRWNDAGWGQFVARDKHTGHFRDELVDALAKMLNERWRPEPRPEWVTCIPSRQHPTLVPDFSRRLATAIGLPFIPIINKIKDNQPQKVQQNKFHQCSNLNGVFGIDRPPPTGPVLLIDDVVDSGWTLTIAAMLLRQTGSGPVWPCALATSNPGA